MPLPKTIDQVVRRLDQITDRAIADEDTFGLFPALYRAMTARVQAGVKKKAFKNAPRMEALVVHFANRYFEAFDLYEAGGEPPKCWTKAFVFAESGHGTYIQHLLLGINAHINLDLSIAVAKTVPAAEMNAFKKDYEKINDVLADLMGPAKEVIAEHSSLLDLVDRVFGDHDDAIFGFSLDAARALAWHNAKILQSLDAPTALVHIAFMDKTAALVSDQITAATPIASLLKSGECEDAPEVIAALRAIK